MLYTTVLFVCICALAAHWLAYDGNVNQGISKDHNGQDIVLCRGRGLSTDRSEKNRNCHIKASSYLITCEMGNYKEQLFDVHGSIYQNGNSYIISSDGGEYEIKTHTFSFPKLFCETDFCTSSYDGFLYSFRTNDQLLRAKKCHSMVNLKVHATKCL